VYLVLRTVIMLNLLPIHLNFSEIPQMYRMDIIHTNLLSLLSFFFLCLGFLLIIASTISKDMLVILCTSHHCQ